jgi:hypothetical protein
VFLEREIELVGQENHSSAAINWQRCAVQRWQSDCPSAVACAEDSLRIEMAGSVASVGKGIDHGPTVLVEGSNFIPSTRGNGRLSLNRRCIRHIVCGIAED